MMIHKKTRLTQAVILAGGRGARLSPLTDTIPKPMIRFHGYPFLHYLIEQLKEQGIREIVMLLGYLPDAIRDCFGDGSQYGISIKYSVSPVEDESGARLRTACNLLSSRFLLLYCDNYWPMRLEQMWDQFIKSEKLCQITAYSNTDLYTKDNVAIDQEGRVLKYDGTRSSSGLSGVDIGYVLINRRIIDMMPDENIRFEHYLYPRLIEKGELGAYVTDHRYYSIGSIERLAVTEEFLACRPAVLLDRDGVLNVKMPPAEYVRSWSDWRWLPGAKEGLALLHRSGFTVMVITNQPGIARGMMQQEDLNVIHDLMMQEVIQAGGRIEKIYFCPHGWDDNCQCRKPKPGMIYEAQREYNLDLSRTFFIGDDERDKTAAEIAGCPFIIIDGNTSLLQAAGQIVEMHMNTAANRRK
ncbi:MAG: HAD-IIIA family hydrolase [Vulcanimicrobiota bacterium]